MAETQNETITDNTQALAENEPTEEVELPSADSFYKSLIEAEAPNESTPTAVTKNRALLSCLFAPTYLMESNRAESDEEGNIRSEAEQNFYICSARAVTIGYGTKIEIKDNQICPEGIDTLKALRCYQDGKEITDLDEKIKIAMKYYALRDSEITVYDKNDNPVQVSYPGEALIDAQIRGYERMEDVSVVSISTENAFDVGIAEYGKKLDKVIKAYTTPVEKDKKDKKDKKNKNTPIPRYINRIPSYFILALSGDLAYQKGSNGVKSTLIYKDAAYRNKLTGAHPTWANSESERDKLRAWMLEMANMFENEAAARGNKPTTAHAQAKLLFKGIQSLEKKFHHQLRIGTNHTALLMQKMTTLLMAQNFYALNGRHPAEKEVANMEAASKDLIFQRFFRSQELADGIASGSQSDCRLNALQCMDTKNLPNESPFISIQKAMQQGVTTWQEKQQKKAPAAAPAPLNAKPAGASKEAPRKKSSKATPAKKTKPSKKAKKQTPPRKKSKLTALLSESQQTHLESERWREENAVIQLVNNHSQHTA